MKVPAQKESVFNIIVLVSALGYFVDIYDLVLFSIVRKTSLLDLGIAEGAMLTEGVALLNWQMGGMLVGGILWGMLGDKKGRISVLFGSIFLYSIANILNGFITDTTQYAALRFIAGIGLAGELGAGITLVSETMTKENRGYGTMMVATIGISGAVVAALVGDFFSWRTAYFVGGGMGLLLLVMRFGVYESGMYNNSKGLSMQRGDFLKLFSTWKQTSKYLSVIFIAVPVWYVVGILITFSPEVGKDMGMTELPNPGMAIMFSYIGITLGDLASGLMSQLLKSRIKVIRGFLTLTLLMVVVYFLFAANSLVGFYTISACVGFATGYWAVFMTTASEQFGTNIRSTVTTTAPNFVRGAVLPITWGFQFLKGYMSTTTSAIVIGILTFTLAYIALAQLKETFGKDLDYQEEF